MSVFYRCWAKRLVRACADVDASWWPPGLYRACRGACLLLEDAKLDNVRPRHVLALDQAKFFDALLCPAIAELARQAGLPDVLFGFFFCVIMPIRGVSSLYRLLRHSVTPFVITAT